jgi:lipoprotein-releasing system ATP-binding protein
MSESVLSGPGGAPPLVATGVEKAYPLADGRTLHILRGVELEVRHGEAVAIVGQSGSGKSSLLHILGALDRPTRGRVLLSGDPVEGLGRDGLARLRNRRVGFVFQFHHLLREFTAVENAAMPALVAGVQPTEAMDRAEALLRAVGLGDRLEHRPWQLSGGEQQRVAVARALVNEPPLLLADEPTGNLDPETSEGLHDLLFRIRAERGLALVLVTHNRELAARANRILSLRSGVLSSEGPEPGVDPGTLATAGGEPGTPFGEADDV